jgi:sulfur-carrier protein adenylyltransferase/sulfurtransferase
VTWYISNLSRYRSEREALGVLGQSVDWLVPGRWRVDSSGHLILDADIVIGARVYPIYLQYPELFPNTPPSVLPRGATERWSTHQFGPGGELCLEYGPDTWTPDLTGVDVVESAHRLLEGENPSTGEKGVVASRHVDSIGQKLRGKYSRVLLTRSLEALLSTIPPGTPLTCTLASARHKECIVHTVYKVTLADGKVWTDETIPIELVEEASERVVPLFRLETTEALPPVSSLGEFRAACVAVGMIVDEVYAIILRGKKVHPYFLWEEDDTAIRMSVIGAQEEAQRLDSAHEVMKSKSMALIGCGSLGSKVATMLSRSGVGRFLLVDDDLLFPDNLVRNDLDWRDVGAHKAEALARRLQLVNPTVDTRVWRARLGGQESNESAEAVLKLIGACDLIFDATANPDILNLVSAVAGMTDKPVIWAEVFGGGIGGLIARCRSGIEPPPQYMRRAIENWFGERGPAPVRSTRSYATGGDGSPLIADDADVSVIAAHAARFAIDILVGREPSLFPHSVYAIGLGVGSVFKEPFDTSPIDVGPPPIVAPATQLSPAETSAEIANIVNLFKDIANEANTSSADHQTPQT